MVEVEDDDDLEAWINSKPHVVSIAIAVRTALRVMPFLDRAYKQNYGESDRLMLATFRALATAWIVGISQNALAFRLVAANDAATIAAVDHAGTVDQVLGDKGEVSYYASFSAAFASNTASNKNEVIDAVRNASMVFTMDDHPAAIKEFWRAVQHDAELIEGGENAAALFVQPLFNHLPDGLMAALAGEEWSRLEKSLSSVERGWKIWIDWYKARLIGQPLNLAFQNAILNLTVKEWEAQPEWINARLKEFTDAGRKPAVSAFEIIDGRIEGDYFPVALAEEPSVSEQIYEVLKVDLAKFAKRLSEYSGHPTVDDILDDISRIQDNLGEKLDDVAAAALLALFDKFSTATDRLETLKTDGQMNLPTDFSVVAAALIEQLNKFQGLFDDKLKLINDRALALRINPADFDRLNAYVEQLVEIAKTNSNIVSPSAITALTVGFEQKRKLSLEIESLDPGDEERRIDRESKRSTELAREIRSQQNLADVVVVERKKQRGFLRRLGDAATKGAEQGAEKGVEKVVSSTIVGSFAAIAGLLAGPVAGFAVFFGATFQKTADELKELSHEDEKNDDASDNGGPE